MKGYYKGSVYMGWIPSERKYMPFESERAYIEYFKEMEA